MKNIIAVVGMILLAAGFMGCYKQVPLGKSAIPAEIKVVGMDDPAPSQDEADIVISTHVKKASYLLSPRTEETPFTFILSIDGQEVREDVKGVEEVKSDIEKEQGKGIHYLLKKRFRLKPGRHEISLESEDRRSSKVDVEVKGATVARLKFEPVYGSRRSKTFWEGVIAYKVYLDGNEIK